MPTKSSENMIQGHAIYLEIGTGSKKEQKNAPFDFGFGAPDWEFSMRNAI